MARRQKDLGAYPELYFKIVADIAAGRYIDPLKMADEKMATSTAHDFNRFKQVMARERHPHFEYALDTIVRKTQVGAAWYLEFVPRGLAVLADELRGSRGGGGLVDPQRRGLPSPHRDELEIPGLNNQPDQESIARFMNAASPGVKVRGQVADGPDPTEAPFEEMLKVPSKKQEISEGLRSLAEEARKKVDPATCKHEWDVTDTHCLYCNSPKPQ